MTKFERAKMRGNSKDFNRFSETNQVGSISLKTSTNVFTYSDSSLYAKTNRKSKPNSLTFKQQVKKSEDEDFLNFVLFFLT